MVTKTKQKTKRGKRHNTLMVVKVEHVQVPDAEQRLGRVFKILMSSFDNPENEAKKA